MAAMCMSPFLLLPSAMPPRAAITKGPTVSATVGTIARRPLRAVLVALHALLVALLAAALLTAPRPPPRRPP